MRKVVVLFLLLLPLTSCEDAKISSGRELYYMYFKEMLRDPSSFVVYKETFSKNGAEVEWKIEYGAKNGFGGMVKEEAEFSTIGDALYIDGSMYEKKGEEIVMIY